MAPPHILDEGRDGTLLSELLRVKCLFQARTIAMVMDLPDRGGSDAGAWADAIAHSPCLKVSDYAPGDIPEALESPASAPCAVAPVATAQPCAGVLAAGDRPFHANPSELKGQPDHV